MNLAPPTPPGKPAERRSNPLPENAPANPYAGARWAIWLFALASLLAIQASLGGGLPTGENQYPPPLPLPALCLSLVAASALVRWLVLPRIAHAPRRLVAFTAGLALAKAAGLVNIALVPHDLPETRLALLILSLGAIAQFLPIAARHAPAR